MASSKRKRRTKHRGNAAGMIESRGRTGRKPTASERSSKAKGQPDRAKARAAHRLDSPPTWKSAAFRAVLAAGAFFGILVLFFKRPLQPSAVIAVVMIGFYTPLGYFTDLWLHRRHVRRNGT